MKINRRNFIFKSGIGIGSFIVPGSVMTSWLSQSLANSSVQHNLTRTTFPIRITLIQHCISGEGLKIYSETDWRIYGPYRGDFIRGKEESIMYLLTRTRIHMIKYYIDILVLGLPNRFFEEIKKFHHRNKTEIYRKLIYNLPLCVSDPATEINELRKLKKLNYMQGFDKYLREQKISLEDILQT